MSTRDSRTRTKAALEAYRGARDPLQRLDAARGLRETAEELEASAIEGAREAGATWSVIGAHYGLTKQGAQQRFRGKGTERPGTAGGKKG